MPPARILARRHADECGVVLVTPDTGIDALVEAAVRRHILEPKAGKRLGRYARDHAARSVPDLRQWLGNAAGLSGDVARKLIALLPPDDLPLFGSYRALAHLADGGMGRVWLAAGTEERLVVVKTIKTSSSATAAANLERLHRFEREARITRQLLHPNVVRCLDSGSQSDGSLYLVLEYIDSGDLRDLVNTRSSLSEPLALAIIYQIVDALVEAHRLHLVHRDIKPPNIFIAQDGKALLADFGIARSTEVERTELTMAGAILGSPQYMSPEQVLGKPADIRSDIYSVGAVLCYCLTGRPPFDGKVQDVLHLHCHVPPPDVRALKPTISARTAALVASCLAKKPEERPADPTALRAQIEQALTNLGVTVSQAMEETHDEPPPSATQTGTLGLGDRSVLGSSDRGEATIIADLSGRDELVIESAADRESPIGSHTGSPVATVIRTLTASLLATDQLHGSEDARSGESTTSARREVGSASGSQAVVRDASGTDAPVLEPLTGDADAALSSDWISLVPTQTSDPSLVMLLARPRLVLGKLKDPSVDITLRNYPVAIHKDALQRLSRQHVVIRYDRLLQQCLVEDLGGTNGTLLDGVALLKDQPQVISGTTAHVLVAAGVVSLWVRCRKARRGGQRVLLQGLPPDADATCGIETDHLHDAVILTRPENRPELSYALVLRRVSIGGPGSDVAMVGARSLASVVIARYAGRWFWRTAVDETWQPLVAGTELDCGGRTLVAQVGSDAQF